MDNNNDQKRLSLEDMISINGLYINRKLNIFYIIYKNFKVNKVI